MTHPYKHNDFDNVWFLRIFYSDGSTVKCANTEDWKNARSSNLQGVMVYEKTRDGQGRPTRVMVWNKDEYDPLDTGFIKTGEWITDEEYKRIQMIAFGDFNI